MINQTADFTVYAQYTAYTLTFDPQGGTVLPTSKSVTYGAAAGSLPTPTKTGYVFSGWSTSSGGSVNFTSATVINQTADFTVYAQYTAATYTLTFDPQGGTVLPTSKSVTYLDVRQIAVYNYSKKVI